MDTIFMNSENSKTSESHVLILKLTDKLDKMVKRLLHYHILAYITHGKIQKTHTITKNLKYQHQHGMMNLNYQTDLILYQIYKIVLNTL